MRMTEETLIGIKDNLSHVGEYNDPATKAAVMKYLEFWLDRMDHMDEPAALRFLVVVDRMDDFTSFLYHNDYKIVKS